MERRWASEIFIILSSLAIATVHWTRARLCGSMRLRGPRVFELCCVCRKILYHEKTPVTQLLSLPIPPASQPAMACSPSSFIPSPCLHRWHFTTYSVFHSLLSFFPQSCYLFKHVPLSLPLSLHRHLKWPEISQRHSTEFASEPLLWENEAVHPGVCCPHN